MLASTTYTTGDLAKHFGVPVWQVLAALRRGVLSEPRRIGVFRIFTDADLPAVRQALIRGGYLEEEVASGV